MVVKVLDFMQVRSYKSESFSVILFPKEFKKIFSVEN